MFTRLRPLTLVSFLLLIPIHASWLSDATGINIDVNRQIGTGIASMSAPVAEQFEQSGHRLIQDMDTALQATGTKLVALLDADMDKRIRQVDAVMNATLSKADQMISAHLKEIDEIAEERIGNLDTVAAKASYNAEEILSRLILLVCVMGFLVFAVWRFYVLMMNQRCHLVGPINAN